MQRYSLAEETLGYVTASDETNSDKRLLVTGSQNVLIDRQKKVKIRSGFTRLGAGNNAETPTRNAWTWLTSTGTELAQKFYDDELEVYLGTIDGTIINAWTRVAAGWSTTEILRPANWFDTTENLDLQIMVQGDANEYEWNGAVAVVLSITGTTITKNGTSTFAQSRFYTTRNKSVTCARTGTTYTYTGGETTITLTGIADTTGLVAGDILVQTIVTQTNKPAASHTNHTISAFENQIMVGSEDDNEVLISKNTDYTAITYSTPRLSGEGGLLTLDAPAKAFGILGSFFVVSAGRSSWFRANYEQITVSTTLAETLKVKKLNTGVDQGAQNQESTVQLGNAIIFLSHEPAVRMISDPNELEGLSPKTLSNPIKPDFDAETFTNACAIWHKNAYYLSAPVNSKVYILEFIEDADGKLKRFWNSPQILPVRAFSVIGDALHGHSNGVPETYKLFDGTSDLVPNGTAGNPDDKVPVNAIAVFAYDLYGDRVNLKTFDEYFSEGEITPATTDLLLTLNYDFGGSRQVINQTIDGTDENILQGNVGFNSLGQQNLGVNPLGGLLNPPDDARKFAVIHEIAREDFRMIQAVFSTNEIDRYWAITTHGANAKLSPRKNITIHQ